MPDKEQTYGDEKSGSELRPPRLAVRDSDPQMQRQTDPATLVQRASLNPGSLTRRDFVQLQHAFGNRAVGQLLKRTPGHTGLPESLRSGVEALSGIPMAGVNVHYNSSQPAQLSALAYTQGRDIHLAPGQEQHLPHEAWHVVQQAQGRVQPTAQLKGGVPVNDDEDLEHEADTMGAHVVAGAAQQYDESDEHETVQGKFALVQRMINRVVQLVRYPAYQTFDASNGNTYCSRRKLKSHAEGRAWIGAVLGTLGPGIRVDGKPRAVDSQPPGAIIQ